jgi:glutamate transport system permease protein
VLQASIVAAIIYIAINATLTAAASWLARRTRRSGRVARPANGRSVLVGAGGAGGEAGAGA